MHNDLQQRIDQQFWKYAKTYSQTAPHEYILKDWNTGLFEEICHLIDTEGYEELFYDKPFTYYNIGKYKYWHIGTVLNRCDIENRYI